MIVLPNKGLHVHIDIASEFTKIYFCEILCFLVVHWRIDVICAVAIRNLWITYYFFCLIAYSLWMYMLRLFGIDWVMSGSVEDLLFCWFYWLGKHSSDIWDLVPRCLMWTIWSERNRRAFEDEGKTVVQLLEFCQKTLFDWSRCWGFSDCSSLTDFISSIRID